MTIDEFCDFLGISKPTIYNWKRDKPNLYKIVMEYKEKKLNNLNEDSKEIVNLFNLLTKEEKEMYICEMKARVLRRKINKKD